MGPLSSRPKLKPGDDRYMDFFAVLNQGRTYSDMGGPQPIQVSEINALLQLEGIDLREAKVKYVRIVQMLDRVYLDYVAEKREKSK